MGSMYTNSLMLLVLVSSSAGNTVITSLMLNWKLEFHSCSDVVFRVTIVYMLFP